MLDRCSRLLKRHFWLPTLALTSVASFFGARGVGNLFGASVGAQALASPPVATARAIPTASDGTVKATSADAILSRNPFDSLTGPLLSAGMGLSESDARTAPACEGVKVFIIAASSDPDWSFAALAEARDGKSVLRRRGDDFDGKEVKFVGWDRVWLASGDAYCQASLFGPKTASVATAAKPADAKSGIARVGPSEFAVERSVIEGLFENHSELMKQVRIVPEQDASGKVAGVRLFGIRPESLLGALGLDNGDRLQSINGST